MACLLCRGHTVAGSAGQATAGGGLCEGCPAVRGRRLEGFRVLGFSPERTASRLSGRLTRMLLAGLGRPA